MFDDRDRRCELTAADTGTRRGEMLALRFAGVDFARGLIVLRGETTKSEKTRLLPILTQRLRAVLQWLRLDAEASRSPKRGPASGLWRILLTPGTWPSTRGAALDAVRNLYTNSDTRPGEPRTGSAGPR